MHLFYSSAVNGHTHLLDEQESKHAIRVLRLEKGDRVVLVDGVGGWHDAEILEGNPRGCLLGIRSSRAGYGALPYYLHVAISPTKNMERFEWFLEKATEIGISEITPLICQRTERRQINQERLEKHLISAMKQSQKAYKPLLHEPIRLGEFLNWNLSGTRGIAHCIASGRISVSDLHPSGSYVLMVGPEGDFTSEEVNEALHAGYKPLYLGEFRLRTETAGVYLCAAIQVIELRSAQPLKKEP